MKSFKSETSAEPKVRPANNEMWNTYYRNFIVAIWQLHGCNVKEFLVPLRALDSSSEGEMTCESYPSKPPSFT